MNIAEIKKMNKFNLGQKVFAFYHDPFQQAPTIKILSGEIYSIARHNKYFRYGLITDQLQGTLDVMEEDMNESRECLESRIYNYNKKRLEDYIQNCTFSIQDLENEIIEYKNKLRLFREEYAKVCKKS